jgi:hypothetical protein
MNPMTVLLLAITGGTAAGFAWACGGQITGDSDGGSHGQVHEDAGGNGGSSGSPADAGGGSSGSEVDAVAITADGARISCSPDNGGSSGIGGVSSNGGTCQFIDNEVCSDGNRYQVNCNCPQGACACNFNEPGGSSGVIHFTDCAAQCAASSFPLAYQECGFPMP